MSEDSSVGPSPSFSIGGFLPLAGSPRRFMNFNCDWKFFKGEAEAAERADFPDGDWETVNLPHGLELVPLAASGCVNYQGPAWYRKRFAAPPELSGKKAFVHFEAIMGKCRVWVNGALRVEHFGGYLPVILDVTDDLDYSGENVIAVWTDNGDDPSFPPGKEQAVLDFTCFGGIYRDAWIIACDKVHITDPNFAGRTAGGGVFVRCSELSPGSATVTVDTDVQNETGELRSVTLEADLRAGSSVATGTGTAEIGGGKSGTLRQELKVSDPRLWQPDDPLL